MRFQVNPVYVEAIQFTGENLIEIERWSIKHGLTEFIEVNNCKWAYRLMYVCEPNTVPVYIGDWIVYDGVTVTLMSPLNFHANYVFADERKPVSFKD